VRKSSAPPLQKFHAKYTYVYVGGVVVWEDSAFRRVISNVGGGAFSRDVKPSRGT